MTEKTEVLVAVHSICTGTGEMVATGRFDRHGEAIMRPLFRDIAPGTRFIASPLLAAECLEKGAAAPVGTPLADAAEARAARERG